MVFDIVASIFSLASDILKVVAMIIEDFKQKVIVILNPKFRFAKTIMLKKNLQNREQNVDITSEIDIGFVF